MGISRLDKEIEEKARSHWKRDNPHLRKKKTVKKVEKNPMPNVISNSKSLKTVLIFYS